MDDYPFAGNPPHSPPHTHPHAHPHPHPHPQMLTLPSSDGGVHIPPVHAAPKWHPSDEGDEDSSDDDIPLAQLRRTPAAIAAAQAAHSASASTTATTATPSSSSSAVRPMQDVDESESSSSEDDVPLAQRIQAQRQKKAAASRKKKRGARNGSSRPAKRAKSSTSSSSSSTSRRSRRRSSKKQVVVNDPSDYPTASPSPLEPENGANKWWARERPKKRSVKWETLKHNGLLFAPPYEPHGVQMNYDGAPVALTPEQEEVATWYAAMLKTDHAQKKTFNKNFFRDWKQLLGPDHRVQKFSKCDFMPIYLYLQKKREETKAHNKTPEVKAQRKADKAREQELYGWAIVDGYKEKVGNFRIEPPGLFRGRGEHPKTGRIKRRIMPEDVLINIGEGEPIPECPVPGHNWKGVVHNHGVTWLAHWQDSINGDSKYVFLAANSRFKGESDRAKYEKARELKKYIGGIRRDYETKLRSKNPDMRQLATALYLIDKLALRVGNEKDTSEEADTVGCCSLRVEHLQFDDDNNQISFDFLGKDSMRYQNTVTVEPVVYQNMRHFCKGKSRNSDVFDLLTTSALNSHLKSLMPGLTAKVFRTYNASITLQKELFESAKYAGGTIPTDELNGRKVLFYNRANREVAILCNHKRSVPKTFDAQVEKLRERLEKYENDLEELEEHLADLTGKKKKKTTKKKKPAKKKKKKKDDDEESSEDEEEARRKRNSRRSKDPKVVRKQIKRKKETIANMNSRISVKLDTKEVALGTAKINYMDPRITVAWCKSVELPIEKVFSRQLLEKFPWAMETQTDWRF